MEFPQEITSRYPWAFVTGGVIREDGSRIAVFDARWATRPPHDEPTAFGIERGRDWVANAISGYKAAGAGWRCLPESEPYPVFLCVHDHDSSV